MALHNTDKEPLIRIVKRDNLPKWQAWLMRAAAVVIALFIGGIVSVALVDGASFLEYFKELFMGVFGTTRRILMLFQNTAILLCIALALAPAFKMKFWNIGAEGQVLMGCLGSVVCIQYLGGRINNSLLILIMFAVSVLFSVAWAVIPAIFKAKWRTNETLFTLMMNYVAMQLVAVCIYEWVPSGSAVLGSLPYGHFPKIGGYNYIFNIIIVAVLVILMFVYFRFSKHGYELSVVGESENTAKYIGINVKKVIIRTMVLCGVACGLAGLLIVAGTDHSVSTTTVGGRGFTAILVAWLGKFSPFAMCFTTLLYTFIDMGGSRVASAFGISDYLSDIITGIFFFFVIACEFFINYKVKFRFAKKKAEKTPPAEEAVGEAEAPVVTEDGAAEEVSA